MLREDRCSGYIYIYIYIPGIIAHTLSTIYGHALAETHQSDKDQDQLNDIGVGHRVQPPKEGVDDRHNR